MREILFKAKRIDNGDWVQGYYMPRPNSPGKPRYYIVLVGEAKWYEIDLKTLCQYTGLKDKNGNRIWENDIVSAWSEGKYATGMVKQRIDGLYIIYPAYQHNEFWRLCPDKNRKTNVEVIGNVFDNPELLKGDQSCTDL